MYVCPACPRTRPTQGHLQMHVRRKELVLTKVLIFNRWELVYVLPELQPKCGEPQKAQA